MKTAVILSIFCVQIIFAKEFPSLDVLYSRVPADIQQSTVSALLQRTVGDRYGEFKAVVDFSLGPGKIDTFNLVHNNGTVTITGSTGVAVAMGLYYYLTQYCKCQIMWGGQQMNIPKTLPKLPKSGITISANDRFRFYQNVCTVSYSFAWYQWEDWEKQLDWMALHGINMPLAFNGQEAIFQRVYMKMGMTFKDMQQHFGGPAFHAWARMGNFRGWGGPITQTWIDGQLNLQHRILDRMRALGMIPVLPGFAGHVPEAMTRLYPTADISRLPNWNNFNDTYCCTYLLDFGDPFFEYIGVNFIKEMEYEFGVDHIYQIDSFNEMNPKSGTFEYLQEVGSQLFNVIKTADPDAIWLMQGWMFHFARKWWNPEQIRALLTAVPEGRIMILDLYSEVDPIYTYTDSYYGQPFIWCMLHDFGGTSEMYGVLDRINTGPFEGRNMANSTMVGLGLTPEGIYQNEVIYEFYLENVWRKQPVDVSKWISDYTVKRYGKYNKYVDLAWQSLKRSVYNDTVNSGDHRSRTIPTSRPQLSPQLKPYLWYDTEDLYQAWDYLIQSVDHYKNNTLFQYDLIDVSRNSLMMLSLQFYNAMVSAYYNNKTADFQENSGMLIGVLQDMETLLASDSHFLLGRWIEAAKRWATDINEQVLLEFNARNLVSLWGPKGEVLDYGRKQWSGLLKGYYIQRWQLFVEMLNYTYFNHTKFNQNQYVQYVYERVELPFSNMVDIYPTEPMGDAYAIAKIMHTKYRNLVDKKFFKKYLVECKTTNNTQKAWKGKYGPDLLSDHMDHILTQI